MPSSAGYWTALDEDLAVVLPGTAARAANRELMAQLNRHTD
ncbi:hypothetical protein [Streptomyces europaeiscabiei]